MVYEPLHHKYRPATFADLVGQTAIASTLTNAIRQERIAPAYLFCGPRGTGKTSSARIFAKSLNCLSSDRPTETPCGTCDTCRSIARGSSLDVIEIDAASNTGVDNIRELIERAQFAPVQARYKVYIIDECHMLSTAAFNSLLKTLEEPPAHVIFILATTDPQRVLPTIISRCQRFDYRRIALEAMTGHLRYIAQQEAIAISDEAITLIAQLAQGGLRDAESVLDQLSLLPEDIDVERVWDLVGAVPERDLLTLLEAIAANNPQRVLEHCRYLLDRGREPPIVMQNLAAFYRDLLIAKTAPQRNDLVAVTANTWEALCHFAKQWDESLILAGSQHLRACDSQVRQTTQPRLWLEVTLLGLLPGNLQRPAMAQPAMAQPAMVQPAMVQPAQTPTVQPAIPPAGVPPASPTPVPATVPQTSAPPPPATASPEPSKTAQTAPMSAVPSPIPSPVPSPVPSPNISPEETGTYNLPQVWQQVIEQLERRATKELLRQQGHLLKFDGQIAHIGVPKALIKMAETKVPDIEAAFGKILDQTIRVSIISSQGQTRPPAPQIAPNPASPAAIASPRVSAQVPPSQTSSATVSGSFDDSSTTTTLDSPPWDNSPAPSQTAPAYPPAGSESKTQVATPDSPNPAISQNGSVAPDPRNPHQDPHQDPHHQPGSPHPANAETTEDSSGRTWDAEELNNVAEQFAQFFNGNVVDLDDDLDFEV
ncbi:DNA polymerase III subunit gamma/tau [Phormidium willei BDU 130791]|nr:DNA polymerase III subunit gamma/tau [Phormidium willei BDU 130791]